MTDENFVACPECGSRKIAKTGKRLTRSGPVQKYQCSGCWRSFQGQYSKKNGGETKKC